MNRGLQMSKCEASRGKIGKAGSWRGVTEVRL